MANIRFKTHHGLNATANSFIDGNLEVTGDLSVSGNVAFSGTSTGDLKPDADQRNLGNTSLRWNLIGFFANLASTLSVGGATSLSNTLNVTGAGTFQNNVTVSGWVNTSSNLVVGGSANISGRVNVAGNAAIVGILAANGNTSFTSGILTVSTNSSTNANNITIDAANVNIDSGVLFIDSVNNRVGINNTAPAVALRVTGAADISSTANIQGNANIGGTLGVTGVSTLSGNVTLSGQLQTISGNTNFDSGVLFVDSVNNRVGINNTAPEAALEVAGSANISTSVNTALLTIGSSFIANTTGAYHTGVVNASSLNVGAAHVTNSSGSFPGSNTSGVSLGSSTARWRLNANTADFSGTVSVGNSTVNSFVSSLEFVSNTTSVLSGTASSNATSAIVTGSATQFATDLVVGDVIKFSGCTSYFTVQSITNATSLTLTTNGPVAVSNTVEKKFVQTVNNSGVFLYGGNQQILPFSNGTHSLGNTTARWSIVGNTGDYSGLVQFSSGINVTGTANVSSSLNVGNVGANTSAIRIGNSTVNSVVNSSVVAVGTGDFGVRVDVGSNVSLTTSGIQVGNSTVNTQVNSSSVATSSGNFGVSVDVGSNVNLTTSSIQIGNSTVNSQVNSSLLTVTTGNFRSSVNVGSNVSVSTSQLLIGNSTVNTQINSSSIFVTSGVSVGSNVDIITSGIIIGNSTVNTVINSASLTTNTATLRVSLGVGSNVSISTSQISVGNSTVNSQVSSNSLRIGGTLIANGATGSAGQVLLSGGAANVYWGAPGIQIVNDTSTDATRFLLFNETTSGSTPNAGVSSTKLTFNPSSGILSAVEFSATSDERLKSEIVTISDALEKVRSLRGVSYVFTETGKKNIGVIAQEIEQVIPEVVNTNHDGFKSVNYGNIIGLLIESIKQLKQEIDELKNGNKS